MVWHQRYDRRIAEMHLPESTARREAYATSDGLALLDAVENDAPNELKARPEVIVLRRVWTRHFARDDVGRVRLRGRGGGEDRIALRSRRVTGARAECIGPAP